MIPVQIRFTKKLIEHIDRLIENGIYSNRSEAIRDAARRLVISMSPDNSPFPKSTECAQDLAREKDV